MNQKLVDIVNEYVEARNQKEFIPTETLKSDLRAAGLKEEQLDDFIMKLDDEFTDQYHYKQQIKSAEMLYWGAMITTIVCACVLPLSYLYAENVVLFPYGFIAGGILAVIWAKAKISRIEHNRKVGSVRWRRYE